MGFLKTEQVHDPVDIELATRLATLLQKARRTVVGKPPDVKDWAAVFKTMRTKDCCDPEEIRRVVTWLESHVSDEFTPKVFSASTFRSKYSRLLTMSKTHRREEISVEALKIKQRLSLLWPQTLDANEDLLLISRSVVFFNEVARKLTTLWRAVPVEQCRNHENVLLCKVHAQLPPIPLIVIDWVNDTHTTIWNNESRRSDLSGYAPHWEHFKFKGLWRQWCGNYPEVMKMSLLARVKHAS